MFRCAFSLQAPSLSLSSLLISVFVEKQEAKELGTISIVWILLGFSNAALPAKPGFVLTSALRAAGAARAREAGCWAAGGVLSCTRHSWGCPCQSASPARLLPPAPRPSPICCTIHKVLKITNI